MSARTVLGAIALTVVGLGAVMFLLDRPEAPPVPATPPAEEASPSSPEAAPSPETPHGSARQSSETLDAPRAPSPAAVFSGLVLDTEGRPVEAVVSWTPAPAELPPSDEELARFVLEESLFAATDSSGRFVFAREPESLYGRSSVLWITSPGHEALSIELPAERELWTRGARHVVSSCARATARVTDRDGVVENAAVRQFARRAEGPARLYYRESRTDAQGLAVIFRRPEGQRLSAVHSDRRSAPWEGVAEGTVELRLAPTFFLGGSVHRSPDLPDSELLEVTCTARVGDRALLLTRQRSIRDRYGPLELPIGDADELVVRLEGTTVVPREVLLQAAPPGEEVRLDLEARPGHVVWFLVEDEAETPLTEAEVTVRWRDTSGRRLELTAGAREDGYVAVPGLPEGWIGGEVRCKDFAPSPIAEIELPEEEPVTHVITLERGGRLFGTCTRHGEPVTDFSLTVWAGDPTFAVTHRFTDRTDGSFEVEGTPLGTVLVVAASAGLGMTQPLQFVTSTRPEEPVEIVLPDSGIATGRVVSAETGAPVAEARVEVLLTDGRAALDPVGPGQAVADDGSFELSGLPAGNAWVIARAPGYSSAELYVRTAEEGETSLGTVRLFPEQELVVALHADRDVVPETCVLKTLDTRGRPVLPPRRFDSNDEVRFDGVSAGVYAFVIDLPDGTRHKVDRELRPGEEWIVPIDLAGRGTLDVSVVPPEGGDLHAETDLVARWVDAGTYGFRILRLDARGMARIEHLPADWIQLDVLSPVALGSERIGQEQVQLREGEHASVRIALGRGDRVLRVVDEGGAPLSGVTVDVHLPGSDLVWLSDLRTDGEGRCLLRGLVHDRFLVSLSHPAHGYRPGIPVLVPGPGEEIELALTGGTDLEIEYVGLRGPVEGVRAWLFTPGLRAGVEVPPSDSEGRTAVRSLAEGDYELHVDEPDYLRIVREISVYEGVPPLLLAMRERCTIEITVLEGGLPRAGLELHLVYADTETDVAEYLGALREIDSGTGTTTTDELGRLVLSRAPEGPYRWWAEAEEGPVHGTFSAEPGVNAVELTLP